MLRTAALVSVLLATTPSITGKVAGIEWTAPNGWRDEPGRTMRTATYKVPAVKGDTQEAELAVFYFGQGQGGDVDANVKRWIGQFKQADGKPADGVSKTSKKKVGGDLEATLIDVTGTYTGMGGPMAPATENASYRLLGAIVQAPEGAVFFKLTGPAKTVAATQKDFDKLLKSIKKG